MKINTREVCGAYLEVIIESGNTIIDLGALREQQARDLLDTLEQARNEIENYLESQITKAKTK